MGRPTPSRSSLIILGSLVLAMVLWTVLVLSWPPLAAADRRILAPPLTPGSPVAEVATAFALLTWPGIPYGVLAGVAYWAFRRRLRDLTLALVIVVVAGWGGSEVLRLVVARPRPTTALDVLAAQGYAYPAGHLVAVVAGCISIGAVFAVTRRSPRRKLAWQVGAVGLVLAVAFDLWLLGAHFLSDLVGGAILGALVAVAALIVTGVTVPVTHEIVQELVRDFQTRQTRVPDPAGLRCAVIYNPIKITDWNTFRRRVEYELRSRGWQSAIWLETSPADSGKAATERAVAEGVDLVLGAGGDGTIRVVTAGLAGTGIPFGLIPAGTGNLLARNLGIPLDEGSALTVAFDGREFPIDLIRVQVDAEPPDYFAVMAGIGIDAVIMQGANPDLKKAVGSAAYFVSAAQYANHPPVQISVRIDDRPPIRRRAHLAMIGNVGLLSGNISLIPDARANDGLLDVLIAAPRTSRDLLGLIFHVVTRSQRRQDEQLIRLQGRRVTLTVDEADHYQLDGDTAGSCRRMTAEVHPAALVLRVPETRPILEAEEATLVAETALAAESSPSSNGRVEVRGRRAGQRAARVSIERLSASRVVLGVSSGRTEKNATCRPPGSAISPTTSRS